MDNPDLFIAQKSLINGWINASQLSECIKLSKKKQCSLAEVLISKGCLTQQQLSSLYEIIHSDDSGTYEPPVEKKFGVYTIISEIGRGGMGVVYKAIAPNSNQPIALKILLKDDTTKQENVARFYREIELASKLKHKNIVPIHHVGAHNDSPFFTMDYIDGETLDIVLKKSAPLEEKFSLKIIEQVASALSVAHKAKIIHRDIKPGNIILGRDKSPYLMDFGIAKCKEKISKPLTRTGTVMGTPEYMPPEQASGQTRLVSFHSDVYALGATLYHMLTGQPPFSGESAIDTIHNIMEEDPLPLRYLNSKISRRTEAIVMKALTKNHRGRYNNAGAFAADLRACIKGEKITARPEFVLKKVVRYIKRNAFTVVCFLITCVAVGLTIFFLARR